FSSAWRFSPWVAVNFRYVLPSLGVLGVLAALGATRLRVREEAVACAVLIGAGRLVDRRFPIALVLVLVALGLSAATRRAGRPWQGAARAALTLSVLVLVLAAGSFWLRRVHA